MPLVCSVSTRSTLLPLRRLLSTGRSQRVDSCHADHDGAEYERRDRDTHSPPLRMQLDARLEIVVNHETERAQRATSRLESRR